MKLHGYGRDHLQLTLSLRVHRKEHDCEPKLWVDPTGLVDHSMALNGNWQKWKVQRIWATFRLVAMTGYAFFFFFLHWAKLGQLNSKILRDIGDESGI